jgi:hypothetical protein
MINKKMIMTRRRTRRRRMTNQEVPDTSKELNLAEAHRARHPTEQDTCKCTQDTEEVTTEVSTRGANTDE